MRSPILYLSHSFKRHQREYYDRLSAVRTDGDWEGWTQFHLACVEEAADVLERIGVLRETSGRQRDRVYAYQAYLQAGSRSCIGRSRGDLQRFPARGATALPSIR
jgi:Fic family protein